ncbi:hypothetical protein [Bradyrhizobium sp. RDM4]|uniref:hypothetical protein n=1 Tax=Bradyrhizobium sp. RDM4 TaxID=3378765 RepID=UPI0038FD2F38
MAGSEDFVEIIKLAGGPTAVIGLGWWLRGKFMEIANTSAEQLDSHERQDERRHRQNLVRFAKINMKLGIADAGESNGDHDGED